MSIDLLVLRHEAATIVHDANGIVHQVSIGGQPLEQILEPALGQVTFAVAPFRPDRSQARIPEEMHKLTRLACSIASDLEIKYNNPCLAASFVSHYFERLTPVWRNLLIGGQHLLAIVFWREILERVQDWERENKVTIHKGTPYFFLAETYILAGDLEPGFIYASHAIDEDKRLGKVCHGLNYPDEAPIFKTVSLVHDKQNHMYELVVEMRKALDEYAGKFALTFGYPFQIGEMDTKLLRNPSLEDIKYLFVFTLWALVDLRRKTTPSLLKNDFSRLKNLNLIFNLCLVTDKLLESNPAIGMKLVSQNVVKLCDTGGWMAQSDLEKYQKSLNVADGDPDTVVKQLLPMKAIYNFQSVRPEVLHLLILWNLRNYGGHNIRQQYILVDQFDEIVRALMNCFFIAISKLP